MLFKMTSSFHLKYDLQITSVVLHRVSAGSFDAVLAGSEPAQAQKPELAMFDRALKLVYLARA